MPATKVARLPGAIGRVVAAQDENAAVIKEAGALQLPPTLFAEAAAALVAVVRSQEFVESPAAVGAALKRELQLSAKDLSRIMRVARQLKPLAGVLKDRVAIKRQRTQFLGNHLPTWDEIDAKLYYAVDPDTIGTGEVRALPVAIVDIKASSIDGPSRFRLQVDSEDLDRLIDGLQTVRSALARADQTLGNDRTSRLDYGASNSKKGPDRRS